MQYGATDHVTKNRQNIQVAKSCTDHPGIVVADGHKIPVTITGNSVYSQNGSPIKLNDMIYCPAISKNLLSLNKLCKDNPYYVHLDDSSIFIKAKGTDEVTAEGYAVDGMYCVELDEKGVPSEVNLAEKASISVWHQRFAHANLETTKRMISQFNLPVCNKSMTDCASCAIGKMHRLHSPSRDFNSAKEILDIVYADVWGPASVPSIEGHRYFVNFVDGFSRMNWIFPIVHKSDVFSTFVKFRTQIEKQTGKEIKSIQTDNGGEFMALTKYLEQLGISHRRACPYSHNQMGVVERRHRHLVDTGISLLDASNLPISFWNYAFCTAAYVYNRTASPSLGFRSPYK